MEHSFNWADCCCVCCCALTNGWREPLSLCWGPCEDGWGCRGAFGGSLAGVVGALLLTPQPQLASWECALHLLWTGGRLQGACRHLWGRTANHSHSKERRTLTDRGLCWRCAECDWVFPCLSPLTAHPKRQKARRCHPAFTLSVLKASLLWLGSFGFLICHAVS